MQGSCRNCKLVDQLIKRLYKLSILLLKLKSGAAEALPQDKYMQKLI